MDGRIMPAFYDLVKFLMYILIFCVPVRP
jgi:hypothetical protein